MASFLKNLMKANRRQFSLLKAEKFVKTEAFLRKWLNETPLWKRFTSKAPPKKEVEENPQEMPDALDLSTGLEKKELLAHLEGKKDPFHMNSIRRGCGTMDNPTLIPSAFDARIVGCICKDNRFINYIWLEKDCPKRCECGHWYKLKTVEVLS